MQLAQRVEIEKAITLDELEKLKKLKELEDPIKNALYDFFAGERKGTFYSKLESKTEQCTKIEFDHSDYCSIIDMLNCARLLHLSSAITIVLKLKNVNFNAKISKNSTGEVTIALDLFAELTYGTFYLGFSLGVSIPNLQSLTSVIHFRDKALAGCRMTTPRDLATNKVNVPVSESEALLDRFFGPDGGKNPEDYEYDDDFRVSTYQVLSAAFDLKENEFCNVFVKFDERYHKVYIQKNGWTNRIIIRFEYKLHTKAGEVSRLKEFEFRIDCQSFKVFAFDLMLNADRLLERVQHPATHKIDDIEFAKLSPEAQKNPAIHKLKWSLDGILFKRQDGVKITWDELLYFKKVGIPPLQQMVNMSFDFSKSTFIDDKTGEQTIALSTDQFNILTRHNLIPEKDRSKIVQLLNFSKKSLSDLDEDQVNALNALKWVGTYALLAIDQSENRVTLKQAETLQQLNVPLMQTVALKLILGD